MGIWKDFTDYIESITPQRKKDRAARFKYARTRAWPGPDSLSPDRQKIYAYWEMYKHPNKSDIYVIERQQILVSETGEITPYMPKAGGIDFKNNRPYTSKQALNALFLMDSPAANQGKIPLEEGQEINNYFATLAKQDGYIVINGEMHHATDFPNLYHPDGRPKAAELALADDRKTVAALPDLTEAQKEKRLEKRTPGYFNFDEQLHFSDYLLNVEDSDDLVDFNGYIISADQLEVIRVGYEHIRDLRAEKPKIWRWTAEAHQAKIKQAETAMYEILREAAKETFLKETDQSMKTTPIYNHYDAFDEVGYLGFLDKIVTKYMSDLQERLQDISQSCMNAREALEDSDSTYNEADLTWVETSEGDVKVFLKDIYSRLIDPTRIRIENCQHVLRFDDESRPVLNYPMSSKIKLLKDTLYSKADDLEAVKAEIYDAAEAVVPADVREKFLEQEKTKLRAEIKDDHDISVGEFKNFDADFGDYYSDLGEGAVDLNGLVIAENELGPIRELYQEIQNADGNQFWLKRGDNAPVKRLKNRCIGAAMMFLEDQPDIALKKYQQFEKGYGSYDVPQALQDAIDKAKAKTDKRAKDFSEDRKAKREREVRKIKEREEAKDFIQSSPLSFLFNSTSQNLKNEHKHFNYLKEKIKTNKPSL